MIIIIIINNMRISKAHNVSIQVESVAMAVTRYDRMKEMLLV